MSVQEHIGNDTEQDVADSSKMLARPIRMCNVVCSASGCTCAALQPSLIYCRAPSNILKTPSRWLTVDPSDESQNRSMHMDCMTYHWDCPSHLKALGR